MFPICHYTTDCCLEHTPIKQYFPSDYSNSDLSAGTPVDKKRQNYIEELIDTEEVYMADMSIVIEVINFSLWKRKCKYFKLSYLNSKKEQIQQKKSLS